MMMMMMMMMMMSRRLYGYQVILSKGVSEHSHTLPDGRQVAPSRQVSFAATILMGQFDGLSVLAD